MFTLSLRCLAAPAALSALFLSSAAHASCGAAFCPVNTQWNTQGIWTEPGWRADLRYEYIPQDQPRAGSDAVGIGQIPHHHDEVKTINRNVLATLDYGFAPDAGVTLMVPVTDRNHTHIHNHMGSQILEQWDFTDVGDVQLMGRYQLATWDNPYVYGVYFGAKLPTGRFHVRNGDGDLAERSLQPGTGTTDALGGAYFRQNFLQWHSSWFMQAIAQVPLAERKEYRPGERLSLDIGYRYDATRRLSMMLQLNGQYKWRDSGLEGEPEDSGIRTLSLSPGVSYGITDTAQLYGFVQLPLYQHVNGVQLTPDWSVVTGVSVHF